VAEKFIDLTKLAMDEDDSLAVESQETVPRRPVTPDSHGVRPQNDASEEGTSMAWSPNTVIRESIDLHEEPEESTVMNQSSEGFNGQNDDFLPQENTDHWMDNIASSDFVAVEVQPQSSKRIFYLVLLFAGVFAGYSIFENRSAWQEELAVVSASAPQSIKINNEDLSKLSKRNYQDITSIENPYWDLPNPMPVAKKPLSRWTRVEQGLWREGIQHEYAFQRYHTLNEVRRYRLGGSEEILFAGLKDKKFWTRMRSLVGLVEFGVPIDIDVVESAMEHSRPSLVANYFKRFQRNMTNAEAYILRQSIKVAGMKSRRSLIKSLSGHNDHYRNLYLAAAIYDPDPVVQKTARTSFRKLGFSNKKIKSYNKFILGESSYPKSPLRSVKKSTPVAPTITAKKVSKTEFSGKVKYYNDTSGADSIDVIEIR